MRDDTAKRLDDPSLSVQRRPRVSTVLLFIIGVATAAAVAFASTFYLMSPAAERAPEAFIFILLAANVSIAVLLAVLIGARLLRLWRNRRHGLAGAALHIRLVALLAAVAVVPAILVFLFSAATMRSTFEELFGERVAQAVQNNRELANAYVDSEAFALGQDMIFLAADLQRLRATGISFETNPIRFRSYLAQQGIARRLAAIYLLDGDRRLITSVDLLPGDYTLPSAAGFAAVDAAQGSGPAFRHEATNEATLDTFRGLLKVEDYNGGYLIAYQPVPTDISEKLLSTRRVRDEFITTRDARDRLETIFAAGFAMLTLIVLLAAIWAGLWAATAISAPVGRLVVASGRVSEGDLTARVDVRDDKSELGVLSRAFNRMTAQLETQRSDLVEANRQSDRRRRFTEAVLSGVGAGVIGLSTEGKVNIANRSAAQLLGRDEDELVGASLNMIAPEMSSIVDEALARNRGAAEGEIEVVRDGKTHNLSVRVDQYAFDDEKRSLVVTFDDITNLISAQRNAAWGDIARRIAHEIKNPLTPIQLSAERLRRKYKKEITTNPDVFDKCTETIVRQVNDIRRMVDEFSSFARMPAAVMERHDLCEIIRSAVFPQRVAAPDISFNVALPDEPVYAECDERLLVQALTNILKNAGESVAARVAADADPAGRIRVTLTLEPDEALISVTDNGLGLPKAERHRLTEPYMTTREKGTGLGLAIVNKVMEEHGGALALEDDDDIGPTGAVVRLTLPLSGATESQQLEEDARAAKAAAAQIV